MAIHTSLKGLFTAIADAIRGKEGTTDSIVADHFPERIAAIQAQDHTDEDAIVLGALSTYVNARVTRISDHRFQSMHSLKSVEFPNVTLVGSYAFADCGYLKSAVMPNACGVWHSAFSGAGISVFEMSDRRDPDYFYMFISECAFEWSKISTLIIRQVNDLSRVVPLKDVNAFQQTPIASGTGYIYVPRALVDSYKTAENWSTFASQFRALEDYTVDGTVTGDLGESKI